MTCLIYMLGLYNIYYNKATWKCVWCNVNDENLNNMNINNWKLCDLEIMINIDITCNNKSSHTIDKIAKKNFEITEIPILNFPLSQIIPCMLHVLMDIVHLLKLLAIDAKLLKLLQNVLHKKFILLKINLPTFSKKKVKLNFEEQLKKAKLNCLEYLKILENYQLLLSALNEVPVKSKKK